MFVICSLYSSIPVYVACIAFGLELNSLSSLMYLEQSHDLNKCLFLIFNITHSQW